MVPLYAHNYAWSIRVCACTYVYISRHTYTCTYIMLYIQYSMHSCMYMYVHVRRVCTSIYIYVQVAIDWSSRLCEVYTGILFTYFSQKLGFFSNEVFDSSQICTMRNYNYKTWNDEREWVREREREREREEGREKECYTSTYYTCHL